MSKIVLNPNSIFTNSQANFIVSKDAIYAFTRSVSALNNAVYGVQPTKEQYISGITIDEISSTHSLCSDVYFLNSDVAALKFFATKPFVICENVADRDATARNPLAIYLTPVTVSAESQPHYNEDAISANDYYEWIFTLPDYLSTWEQINSVYLSAQNDESFRLSSIDGGKWELIGSTSLTDEKVSALFADVYSTIATIESDISGAIDKDLEEIRISANNLCVEISKETDRAISAVDDLSAELTTKIDEVSSVLCMEIDDLRDLLTDELSGNINPKLSVIADSVKEEVAKLDELSGKLSGYAYKDHTHNISAITNLQTTLDSKVSAVTINGSKKTPTNGTIDLGTVAGTLNTTLTASQTTNASESLSGNINLHKISKTGSWDDLLDKPFIPLSTSQLSNDKGFITSADVSSINVDKVYYDTTQTSTITVIDGYTKGASLGFVSNYSGSLTSYVEYSNSGSDALASPLAHISSYGGYADQSELNDTLYDYCGSYGYNGDGVEAVYGYSRVYNTMESENVETVYGEYSGTTVYAHYGSQYGADMIEWQDSGGTAYDGTPLTILPAKVVTINNTKVYREPRVYYYNSGGSNMAFVSFTLFKDYVAIETSHQETITIGGISAYNDYVSATYATKDQITEALTGYVDLTSNQTINGKKTFGDISAYNITTFGEVRSKYSDDSFVKIDFNSGLTIVREGTETTIQNGLNYREFYLKDFRDGAPVTSNNYVQNTWAFPAVVPELSSKTLVFADRDYVLSAISSNTSPADSTKYLPLSGGIISGNNFGYGLTDLSIGQDGFKNGNLTCGYDSGSQSYILKFNAGSLNRSRIIFDDNSVISTANQFAFKDTCLPLSGGVITANYTSEKLSIDINGIKGEYLTCGYDIDSAVYTLKLKTGAGNPSQIILDDSLSIIGGNVSNNNTGYILFGRDNSIISSANQFAVKEALSGLSDIYALSDEVVDGLSNVVVPKLSVIADLISAEVERVDEISGNYVPLSDYQALELRVAALESRLSDIETIVDQINGTN